MKTTYLDNEIILLEGYKKEGIATPYQLRKLAEYRQIKQLIISNVVGQSEQLVCPHQATRTPNEEKTGKCRQCGRKIKAN